MINVVKISETRLLLQFPVSVKFFECKQQLLVVDVLLKLAEVERLASQRPGLLQQAQASCFVSFVGAGVDGRGVLLPEMPVVGHWADMGFRQGGEIADDLLLPGVQFSVRGQ